MVAHACHHLTCQMEAIGFLPECSFLCSLSCSPLRPQWAPGTGPGARQALRKSWVRE